MTWSTSASSLLCSAFVYTPDQMRSPNQKTNGTYLAFFHLSNALYGLKTPALQFHLKRKHLPSLLFISCKINLSYLVSVTISASRDQSNNRLSIPLISQSVIGYYTTTIIFVIVITTIVVTIFHVVMC